MSEEEEVPHVSIPHDVLNEQILIASALVDPLVRDTLLPKVQAGLFIDTQHGLTWEAMQRMHQKKLIFDLPALALELGGSVDTAYLQSLIATYPTAAANIGTHVSSLRWDHTRAETTRTSLPDFLRAMQDPKESPAKVKALARAVEQSLDVALDRSFMANPRLLANSHKEEIRGRMTRSCYEYGLPALDYFDHDQEEPTEHRLIPGAAPKKITLITGVSGSGKSVVAARIGLEQARRGRQVLYGAWEMGDGDTIEMMANTSLSWSRTKTSTGKLDEKDLDQHAKRMEEIGQYVHFFDPPFHQDPSRKYSNDDALDELHRQIADSGCEVVILDLWERCIQDGSPGPERRALFKTQQIAKATGTHIILVCQQKLKEVEGRKDKKPTRNTILGSSAWVDIADTILGVHRPALWKPITDDVIEISILKQRFGKWPMNIQFEWDGELMKIAKGQEIEYEHPGTREQDGLF